MNYEDKYKQALDRAKKLYEQVTITESLGYVFPELAEPEDERIRKGIIDFIKYESDIYGIKTWFHGYTTEEIIAWLEKQGKSNVFDAPKTSIKDAVEITSRIQHIEDDMKPIAEFIINYANWNLHKDEWNQPTLTVPLFRVLDALIQRGKPYGECAQNIEKQGEQSNGKIEPKKIYADKVIAWLVANICDFEYYIERFKQDFGL